jgi:hypothetical protein
LNKKGGWGKPAVMMLVGLCWIISLVFLSASTVATEQLSASVLSPKSSVESADVDSTVCRTGAGNKVAGMLPANFGTTDNEFTIVLLPDTQWYTVNGEFWFEPAKGKPRMTRDGPETFHAMTKWIVDNRDKWNIAYVAQVGDLIESHGEDTRELEIASQAMGRLEEATSSMFPDGIPFGIAVGNHEQNPPFSPIPEATASFNKYFGPSRFQGRNYYGGHYGNDNDNHYSLFSAGGMDFIVIYVECFKGITPASETVIWARNLLRDNSNRRGIVVAHLLLTAESKLHGFGAQIYSGLKSEPNLFLMLSGHTGREGHLTLGRPGLQPVHAVMADYSERSHKDEKLQVNSWQGGNGWMHLLKFRPARDEIEVYTYSPTMNNGKFDLHSPHGQFEIDADSRFTLRYKMVESEAPVSKAN